MNFQFDPEDEIFRDEVRQFFRENVPADIARRNYVGAHPPSRDDVRTWQGILHRQGWGAPHWPKEYGGTDWSPIRKHIFMQELYDFDGPDYSWQGLHMAAPVLIEFGTQAQKNRFLAPMLSGEEMWCQGFSEPNAGSDLANLNTRAVRDGDDYVVNGQKIWTSDAAMSEWGFFLVRTDTSVKPQSGISFLLIDMASPGITIRPITSIDAGHGLNEVFLDDVRVPVDNLIGEAGMGWTYAKFLLGKERTTSAFLYFNKRELEKTKEIARQEMLNGAALIDCPDFSRRLAEVEADLLALEWSVLRILTEERNKYNADAVVSALKLRGSAMQQRVTELQLSALGPRALRFYENGQVRGDELWPDYVPGKVNAYVSQQAATIYGGSREVQKNIIAKLAFGL